MLKKMVIILFFMVFIGAGHAVPLQGLAFADTRTQDGQPCPPECVTDSMEIVTWYPSPYNEYEELRLYPVKRDDPYCTDDKKGLMYYDDNNTPMDASDDKVRVCMGSNSWTGGGWQALGHWEYFTDSATTAGTVDIKPSSSGVVKIQNLKIDQATTDGFVLTSDANGNASWKTLGGAVLQQISGTNPVCSSNQGTLIYKWLPKTCGNSNQECGNWGPSYPCTTVQKWSESAPTCDYGYYPGYCQRLTGSCGADSWSDVICVGS